MYTKNPWTTPILTATACAFAPTAFSAVVEALAKVTCTCDEMALAIVGPRGIEPVTFTPIIVMLVAFVVVGLVAFVVAFVVVGLVAFVVVGLVVVVEGKRMVICAYTRFIEHSAAINKIAITIATYLPGSPLVGLPCEFNL
jgi:hypothetical protein